MKKRPRTGGKGRADEPPLSSGGHNARPTMGGVRSHREVDASLPGPHVDGVMTERLGGEGCRGATPWRPKEKQK